MLVIKLSITRSRRMQRHDGIEFNGWHSVDGQVAARNLNGLIGLSRDLVDYFPQIFDQ